MELTPDVLATGFIGFIVIVGAIGTYLRSLRQQAQQPSPVFAGVGGGLVDRDQMERLIAEVAGIRKAAESIADKKASDMQEAIEEIAEELKTHPRR
jgi:hypothetical protein